MATFIEIVQDTGAPLVHTVSVDRDRAPLGQTITLAVGVSDEDTEPTYNITVTHWKGSGAQLALTRVLCG